MKPTYHNGFSFTVAAESKTSTVTITHLDTREVTSLTVTPENCDTVDAEKFARQFIDGILIPAFIVQQ